MWVDFRYPLSPKQFRVRDKGSRGCIAKIPTRVPRGLSRRSEVVLCNFAIVLPRSDRVKASARRSLSGRHKRVLSIHQAVLLAKQGNIKQLRQGQRFAKCGSDPRVKG